jgi:hypothetical protein
LQSDRSDRQARRIGGGRQHNRTEFHSSSIREIALPMSRESQLIDFTNAMQSRDDASTPAFIADLA